MSWMHRALILALAACWMTTLVGCEQKKKPNTPEAPANTTDTP